MGARIVDLARAESRFEVVAAVDRDDVAHADMLSPGSFDVIIDFSSDEGAQHAAHLAMQHRAALLVGTTGLSPKSLEIMREAARFVAVMIAPNTSLGVAVVTRLITEAARRLGPAFQIDITETHHVKKKDAPSGTALRLAQALHDDAGVDLPPGRIHSIREGEVIGEHEIRFTGPEEILKIVHSATNRDLFARGALHAAAWLHGRPAGQFTIDQALE
jgi:4-hydroxy-tetrahydrodipicolinate reductase